MASACVRERWHPARRAVTLIELLLVVTLLMLLAAFSWPSFSDWGRAEQLEESARRLKALIAMCRAEAMSSGQRYRITIRVDGSVKLRRQLDPIRAPQVYVPVEENWARMKFLLDEVWVESVSLLPDGPPPIRVEDELMEFEDMEEDFEPVPIEEFENPIDIDFLPDGTSRSLRWTLRDALGRGIEMTLDGRVGRVSQVWVERIPPEELQRPPEVDLEAEAEAEQELWDEYGWSPRRQEREP